VQRRCGPINDFAETLPFRDLRRVTPSVTSAVT